MAIAEIIKGLIELVPNLVDLPKEQKDRKDAALRAIIVALDETHLYYRDQERGAKRDFDRETQLAKYWSAAAIPMRHVDPDLAERCDFKAEYWLNPDRYSQDQIVATRIELNSVRSAYRSLIHPRPWKSMR